MKNACFFIFKLLFLSFLYVSQIKLKPLELGGYLTSRGATSFVPFACYLFVCLFVFSIFSVLETFLFNECLKLSPLLPAISAGTSHSQTWRPAGATPSRGGARVTRGRSPPTPQPVLGRERRQSGHFGGTGQEPP